MPKRSDGDQRSARAHNPEDAAGCHDPPAHSGAETPDGKNSATGSPAPTASATANQVPDPPPETPPEKSGPGTGRHTTGHGTDGKATNPPPGPEANAACKTNRDRTANAAGPADRGTHTTDAPDSAAAAAHDLSRNSPINAPGAPNHHIPPRGEHRAHRRHDQRRDDGPRTRKRNHARHGNTPGADSATTPTSRRNRPPAI